MFSPTRWFLRRTPRPVAACCQVKGVVDKFVYAKKSDGGGLLEVSFDSKANDGEGAFMLGTADGSFSKESEVSESEDVSYVSSPYLPMCLRKENRFMMPFTSNAHRAHEAAQGESQVLLHKLAWGSHAHSRGAGCGKCGGVSRALPAPRAAARPPPQAAHARTHAHTHLAD